MHLKTQKAVDFHRPLQRLKPERSNGWLYPLSTLSLSSKQYLCERSGQEADCIRQSLCQSSWLSCRGRAHKKGTLNRWLILYQFPKNSLSPPQVSLSIVSASAVSLAYWIDKKCGVITVEWGQGRIHNSTILAKKFHATWKKALI